MSARARSWRWLPAVLVMVVMLGCRARADAVRADPHATSATPGSALPSADITTDGEALIRKFECSRCHEGTGAPAPTPDKACVGCHQQILAGTFAADPDSLTRWQTRISHFLLVPSLATTRGKLRRSWLEKYLLEPQDLRPGLPETMPRLEIKPEEARMLAAYLATSDAEPTVSNKGSLERGRDLLDRKGCGTCHRMSGVPPFAASSIPVFVELQRLSQAVRLAPDLALARQRLVPGYLERWLSRPSAIDKSALMPDIPLTPEEIRDIAAYLLRAPLQAQTRVQFVRLPLLERTVPFAEVKARVFRDTCWHCHSDPDYALGDGGPGNTGGFGFRGRGINLAEHEGLLAGYVDDPGARRSLFRSDGGSGGGRLVAALLARHDEEQGRPMAGIRGMPLGLPALSAQDIQLVETWIAQGRAM